MNYVVNSRSEFLGNARFLGKAPEGSFFSPRFLPFPPLKEMPSFAKNYPAKWENENDLEVPDSERYAITVLGQKKPS